MTTLGATQCRRLSRSGEVTMTGSSALRLEPGGRRVARLGMSAVFLTAGVGHFAIPRPFEKIVPNELPAKRAIVYATGVVELVGGLLLLMPRVPQWVGNLLAAFLVLVFPANLNQALRNIQFDPDRPVDRRLLWARLPIQAVMIALVLYATRRLPDSD